MAKKYIESDALIAELDELSLYPRLCVTGTPYWNGDMVTSIINRMGIANVVEVVRCKDCDNWEYIGNLGLKRRGSCAEWSDAEDGITRYTDENDFCSYGERKDG